MTFRWLHRRFSLNMALALLLGSASVACGDQSQSDETPSRSAGPKPTQEAHSPAERENATEGIGSGDQLLDQIWERARRYGSNREELAISLGVPSSVRDTVTQNPYCEAMDTSFAVQYDVARFSLIVSGCNGREFLRSVSYNNAEELPGAIAPSSTTKRDIESLFGEPRWETEVADTLVAAYTVPATERAAEEYVMFYLVAGIVQKIVVSFYVD